MTDSLETGPVLHERDVPGTVEVWQGSNRLWRYRCVHPGSRTGIRSNRSFVTREEAVESARLAYPEVPVVELSRPPDAASSRHRWRKFAVVTILTAGVGLIAVGAIKLMMFIRRVARGGKQFAEWIGVAVDLTRRDR